MADPPGLVVRLADVEFMLSSQHLRPAWFVAAALVLLLVAVAVGTLTILFREDTVKCLKTAAPPARMD